MALSRGTVTFARNGEFRHRAGHAADRHREVRGRAAIDAPTGDGFARDFLGRGTDRLLQRVVNLHIFRPGLQMLGHGQEPRMLARAVVVQLARAFVGLDQPVTLGPVIGFMRPAAQIAFLQTKIGNPASGKADMHRSAFVAGAGQRQMPVGQPARVRRPGFDQRQGLDHLAGRPGEGHGIRVAPSLNNPLGIANHRMPQMCAFQKAPAPDFRHRNRTFIHLSHDAPITFVQFCAMPDPRVFHRKVFFVIAGISGSACPRQCETQPWAF